MLFTFQIFQESKKANITKRTVFAIKFGKSF